MKTPQQSYPDLAKYLGVADLYLKREDLHPYGSHKGRSIPHMIKTYTKDGIDEFVISSSGNAALAAAMTVAQHNKNNPGKEISLTIYVGQNIDEKKLKKIKTINNKHPARPAGGLTINKVERPKQAAFQAEKANPDKVKNLRQSTDDLALEGYYELASELEKIKNLSAIFIPTSSGTTAEALGKYFLEKDKPVQIHIVQTDTCHPIADEFVKQGVTSTSSSLATAIVDNIAHRKENLVKIIKKTNGSGWIVKNEDVTDAIKNCQEKTGIKISPNSALSIAGLKRVVENGSKFTGSVVCLITGE